MLVLYWRTFNCIGEEVSGDGKEWQMWKLLRANLLSSIAWFFEAYTSIYCDQFLSIDQKGEIVLWKSRENIWNCL